jgi:hypothetical protein
VKAGWKSTETWLMFAGFGLLGWVLERLVEILPVLATQPNIPPWVSAVIPIAMTGIAWVMKASAQKYLAARTELKLQAGAPSTPAQAADQVNKL